MSKILMWNAIPEREGTSGAEDAAHIAFAALVAGEGGFVLLIGGIVLGGVLGVASLLLHGLRGPKDHALVL
jgi:hypothetical protein